MNFDGISSECKCVNVHDGDTITVELDLRVVNKKYYEKHIAANADVAAVIDSLPPCMLRVNCRMFGYNCAELNSKDPKEKAQAIKDTEIMRRMVLGKTVMCEFGKTDTYNRTVTTVYCEGESINDKMLAFGHQVCGTARKGFNYVEYP